MIQQLRIYLIASALLGSPLLAQDTPRPQPAPPGAPGTEPRKDDDRRGGGPRDPNAEPPLRPPLRPDGARPPRPPLEGDGFDPDGPPPGGPGDFQRRPPGGRRGEGPDGERPPMRTDRQPEGFARPPIAGERSGQYERALKSTPYIGVVTSPVSPALAAQLGLNEGFGLVVDDVLPDSPAQAVGLQRFDVLKLVNDQQLVDPGQLSGLLRGLGKDTEISITYIRKGQEQKATAKIAEKMLPDRRPGADLQRKLDTYGLQIPQREQGDDPRGRNRGPQGPGPEQMRNLQERIQRYMDEMNRYQEQLRQWQKDRSGPLPELPPTSELEQLRGNAPTGPSDLFREARPGGAPQLRLPQADGISTFQMNRARIAMRDNDGELEIALNDGQRTLIAKNPAGEVVFTGPVDTPEQRAAMPPPIRAKLDAIEFQQRSFPRGRAPVSPGSPDALPFPPPPAPVPNEREVQ